MTKPTVLFLCTLDAVRPIRDDVEARVRRLLEELGINPAT
jgi:hypothetical protein